MNKHLFLFLLFFSLSFCAQTYCVPQFSDGCDDGDQIDSFSIPSVSFNHVNTGCSLNAYGDFTTQIINLNAGVNYNFSMTHGFSEQNVKIWIDFNNDGVFTDAAPELVASGISTTVNNQDITDGILNIPATVAAGTYRMRIADQYDLMPTPCNIGDFGEVHDYTVVIAAAPTCLAPSNLNLSSITASSAVVSWVASLSSPSSGYEYYLSTNPVTPASSALATGSTNSLNASLALAPSTTYYIWVRSVCNAAGKSAWSASSSFTSLCAAITPFYSNSFTVFPGDCWQQASGGNLASGSTGNNIYWLEDGFLNVNYTGAARINLFDQNRVGWLKSPAFNLSAGNYRVKFNYGLTSFNQPTASAMGSDDIIQFAISNDGGVTWTALQTWTAANAPSNTSNQFSLNLTSYNSANTVFAFYGSDGTVVDPEDYDFFIDDFTVESIGSLATAQNFKENDKIVVYPNPFVNVLNIKNSDEVESAVITDFNVRVIKRFEKFSSELNVSELSSGIYLLNLKLKNGSQQTHKIIRK
ncbi:GEVED domain-containing protein [Chryseobacterium sp. Leaf394]|uniref:GEVED domain-containing protein n=1 Tax=Chryseobacterium sp. Leaf394 TaxID=1736361 RepID=UPI0006FF60CC|nr:GEVED domain-containing protein [Chryseobacterium sp. Leaf394]KQS91547.1 hypothetical protein ASG21_03490 [Chryseobacterium sp. Leaf394]